MTWIAPAAIELYKYYKEQGNNDKVSNANAALMSAMASAQGQVGQYRGDLRNQQLTALGNRLGAFSGSRGLLASAMGPGHGGGGGPPSIGAFTGAGGVVPSGPASPGHAPGITGDRMPVVSSRFPGGNFTPPSSLPQGIGAFGGPASPGHTPGITGAETPSISSRFPGGNFQPPSSLPQFSAGGLPQSLMAMKRGMGAPPGGLMQSTVGFGGPPPPGTDPAAAAAAIAGAAPTGPFGGGGLSLPGMPAPPPAPAGGIQPGLDPRRRFG